MSSYLINIIFSIDDVESMAEEAGIPIDIAWERAQQWAPYIEDTAVSLITEQLYSVVENDSP